MLEVGDIVILKEGAQPLSICGSDYINYGGSMFDSMKAKVEDVCDEDGGVQTVVLDIDGGVCLWDSKCLHKISKGKGVTYTLGEVLRFGIEGETYASTSNTEQVEYIVFEKDHIRFAKNFDNHLSKTWYDTSISRDETYILEDKASTSNLIKDYKTVYKRYVLDGEEYGIDDKDLMKGFVEYKVLDETITMAVIMVSNIYVIRISYDRTAGEFVKYNRVQLLRNINELIFNFALNYIESEKKYLSIEEIDTLGRRLELINTCDTLRCITKVVDKIIEERS